MVAHPKRIRRNRPLSSEEAAKYREVRKQVAEETPELIERHQERLVALDELAELVQQLKAAREEKGLSLSISPGSPVWIGRPSQSSKPGSA